MFKRMALLVSIGVVSVSLLVGCNNGNKVSEDSNKPGADIEYKLDEEESLEECEYCFRTRGSHEGDCPVVTGDMSEYEPCAECGEVGEHLEFCPTLRAGQEYTGEVVNIKRAPDEYLKIDNNTVPTTVDVSLIIDFYVRETANIIIDEKVNKGLVRNEEQYLDLVYMVSEYMDAQLKELGCPPLGANIFYQLLHNKTGVNAERLSYPGLIDVTEPTNKLEEIIYNYINTVSRYDRNGREFSKLLTDNGYPVYINSYALTNMYDYRIDNVNK